MLTRSIWFRRNREFSTLRDALNCVRVRTCAGSVLESNRRRLNEEILHAITKGCALAGGLGVFRIADRRRVGLRRLGR